MPQLSYSQTSIPAQPGMPFDSDTHGRDIVSAVASVNIAFGTLCEIIASGSLAGQAQPVQDTGTTSTFLPGLAGIAMFDSLGVEQQYATWGLTTSLSGTVHVTNGSTSVTFSTGQTLAAGQQLIFASQPGVIYQVATATSSSTSATLVTKYSGTTATATTTTEPPASSSSKGWLAGMEVPFMRRGRIWVAGDGGGTATRTGAINVWHSSTGANPQGVFTYTAAQTTAGAEIDIAPNCLTWNPNLISAANVDPFGNLFTVYPVEILV